MTDRDPPEELSSTESESSGAENQASEPESPGSESKSPGSEPESPESQSESPEAAAESPGSESESPEAAVGRDAPSPHPQATFDLVGTTEASSTESPPDARSSRLIVALAALLVLSLIFGGLQWRRAAGLQSEAGDRQAIATAATQLGTALLSYDYQDIDASRELLREWATEEFGESYEETLDAGLEQIIVSLEAVAEATVIEVYVTEVDGDEAKAIAVFDSEVRSQAGVRTLEGSYLEMELVRTDGRWLVSAVTAVAAAGDQLETPEVATPPEPDDEDEEGES
jgi:hypothetical protein